jgi:hypothetical protein
MDKRTAGVKMKELRVSIGLPFGLGSIEGTWAPDDSERRAAWEMYVELITRIAIQQLGPGEGLLREALSSLYTLFDTTREILRSHGPTVAVPKGGHDLSFGLIAVTVLNKALRPLLAKWHPELSDYESQKPAGVSPVDYERHWAREGELRQALEDLRPTLLGYANILAQVAGVPPLIA